MHSSRQKQTRLSPRLSSAFSVTFQTMRLSPSVLIWFNSCSQLQFLHLACILFCNISDSLCFLSIFLSWWTANELNVPQMGHNDMNNPSPHYNIRFGQNAALVGKMLEILWTTCLVTYCSLLLQQQRDRGESFNTETNF